MVEHYYFFRSKLIYKNTTNGWLTGGDKKQNEQATR